MYLRVLTWTEYPLYLVSLSNQISRANIKNVDLRATTIMETSIANAKISGEMLSTCILSEVDFVNAIVDGKIEKLIASDCNFIGLKILNGSLERCSFTSCKFEEAGVTGTRF